MLLKFATIIISLVDAPVLSGESSATMLHAKQFVSSWPDQTKSLRNRIELVQKYLNWYLEFIRGHEEMMRSDSSTNGAIDDLRRLLDNLQQEKLHGMAKIRDSIEVIESRSREIEKLNKSIASTLQNGAEKLKLERKSLESELIKKQPPKKP